MNPLLRLKRLTTRDAAEQELRAAQAGRYTVAERLEQALELSDLARELASSVGSAWVTAPPFDLGEKARRHPIGR